MPKFRMTILDVAVVATILLLLYGMAVSPAGVQLDPTETQQVKKKIESIKAEVRSLADHDWAGSYYRGARRGAFLFFLAPKIGASFQDWQCTGISDHDLGAVQEHNGRIKIAWEFSPGKKYGRPPEYLLVRWGMRHYLLAPNEVEDFRNAVRTKEEPRPSQRGRFLLRDDDEKLPVEGEPVFPSMNA